jgi:hypothetical protein
MLNCTGTRRIMPVRVCPARSYHLLCSQSHAKNQDTRSMLPAVQAHVTGPIPVVSVLPGGCFSLTGQPRTQRHRRVLYVRQHMAVSVSLCRAPPRSFLERTVTVLDLLYSDPLALARGGTRLNDWFVNNQRARLKKRKRHACSAQS